MALFGFGKKKDEEKNIPACACQSDCATFEATEEDANKVKIEDGAMSVKVLGVGCASCHEQWVRYLKLLMLKSCCTNWGSKGGGSHEQREKCNKRISKVSKLS